MSTDKKPGKMVQRIAMVTGVMIAVAAMINSTKDVYVAILDLPIGTTEKVFDDKKSEHFREEPIFDTEVDIPIEGSRKTLGIYVYSNADIYVNYSGEERWLPSESLASFDIDFSLFNSAYAEDKRSFGLPKARIILGDYVEAKNLEEISEIKINKSKELEDNIVREYWFEEVKKDHGKFFRKSSKNYTLTFKAVDGYKIENFLVTPVSESHADLVKQSLNNDSTVLTVTLRLTSGPAMDRWRGWMKGKVTTNQVLLSSL